MFNEKEVVTRILNGDMRAFELLVKQYEKLVFYVTFRLVKEQQAAEDICQEVFIKVYESVHQFKGESAFSTWLYRIAVTKSLEMIRNRKRKKRFAFITGLFGDSNELRHDPPDFVHPGVQLDNREKASVLFKAIEKLPENQRIAFTLHKVEGVPYQEISEIMKITVSAVESLIHRAKANLRKWLEDFYLNEM